jgi:hypothetical protein
MPATVTLGLFLAAPQEPSDLAGLIASGTAFNTPLSGEGRILKNTAGGVQVIINTPASLSALGSSVTVEHVTAQTDDVTHTVVTKKRVKVRKKTKHHPAKFKIKKIKTTHHLLTTPGVCNLMPWKTSVSFTFGDGTSSTLDAPILCATP